MNRTYDSRMVAYAKVKKLQSNDEFYLDTPEEFYTTDIFGNREGIVKVQNMKCGYHRIDG